MYENTSEEFNNIIKKPGRTFKARLIRGTDIISDIHYVSITQSCNNEEKIGLGGGVSSYIDVVISNTTFSLENVEYELQIGMKLSNGEYEYVPMGLFTPKKPVIGSEVTKFIAYGRLYSALSKAYFSEIETYPVDAKKILEEIESMTGIPVVTDNLQDGIMVNMRPVINENTVDDDGNSIENTTYEKPFNGYTYRETLCYIAQLYGKCVVEDRIGRIIFKWFSKVGVSIDRNQYKDNMQQSESEFFLSTIHCTTGAETLISGAGYSGIAIDNPIMTQERLDKVYQLVGGFHCKGIELDMIGNICIDIMDILSIQFPTGSVNMPVVRLITTFDGGISQKSYCYGGSEQIEETEGPTAERIDRMYNELLLVKEVMADKISVDSLNAQVAKLGYANIKELSVEVAKMGLVTIDQANVNFLKADMSNITIASIETLFATSGIFKDITVKDGHITGVLDSVTVNANSITTGTLSVDRLIIRGSDKSLVYELNNISGALQSKRVDTLNGEILTPRTITADKLVAKSITANEIAASTITANEIAAGTITASQINMTNLVGNSAFINAISSNSVVVGLRTDLDGISVGGRNLVKGTSETLITCNYPSSSYINAFDTKATKALKAGKYTMSFYAKSTVDGDKIYCFLYSPNNVTHIENSQGLHDSRNDGQSFIVLSTTLKKYWVTFTVNEYDRAPSVLFGRLYCGDGTGTVSIGSCKFEEGNKATDWTPAPEDVDSLISAAQSTANSANSLASTANGTANSALTGLNNLEIGGNNLLRNSADLTKWNKETGVTVTKQNDGYFYIKQTDTSKTGRWGIYQDIAVQQNTNYTIAVDGRTNVCFSIGLGTTYGWGNAVVANEKTTKRYVYKFNTGSNTCLRVYLNDQGNAGVYLKCPKLEKGNKATDWTMAIEDWCYNNDITYINGGKIYTGTVTADKLAANSVTADKILAGAITADKLSVDAITSRNYVKDTSGTKISLADGSYDSKYTKIDPDGKISCQSAEIKGRLSCYGDLELVGGDYQSDGTFVENGKRVEVSTYGSKLGHMLHMGKYDDYLNVIAYDFRACNGAPGEVEGGISLRALDSSLTDLANKVYTTDAGLFNTPKALLINGNALNSQWAQIAIEYNGLYFGIRNDGGNTYFMPGNSNGWYDCYSYVGSDGQWHFANNVYLPGTLQANGLNMPSRTGTQTTAKPNCYIDTNGTFYKTSTASSRSVKDDIKLLESEELNPSRLYDVSIYQFKYKTTYLSNKEDTRYKKDMIGFILENLHEKYPIAVDCHMDEAGKIIYDSWNEQYLIPAMLKLIQDQHNELINQSMKIQNLEIRLLFMNA